MKNMKQVELFDQREYSRPADSLERQRLEEKFAPLMREELRLANQVSYMGNKDVPILRLYRYKEAFALSFVEDFIERFKLTGKDYIFDPFCGMGTTLLAAMRRGIPSIGVDKLPIATFIARTLPIFFSLKRGEILSTFERLRAQVARAEPADIALDVKIMNLAFPKDTLLTLRRWKTVIDALEPPLRDIFLLLFFSILEPCSYTAKDGQFLRLKPKKKLAEPEEALYRKVLDAERDIRFFQQLPNQWSKGELAQPTVLSGDARNLQDVPFSKLPTAIITSPPYANRYDYTRTYSLELCFHFVKNFEELKAIRFGILRSHIESKVEAQEEPPHPAVKEVIDILKEQRKKLNNPRIPYMLMGYFIDMQKVIGELTRVLAPGAKVAMVVDNVRFEGEMVPVDLVLSEMAEEAGFKIQEVIITRYKGNSSQQMGKYGRVPVRESIIVWGKDSRGILHSAGNLKRYAIRDMRTKLA
ncbi:MAG: hypothetical protein ACUVV0_04005 [Anaerolineae bacterium]